MFNKPTADTTSKESNQGSFETFLSLLSCRYVFSKILFVSRCKKNLPNHFIKEMGENSISQNLKYSYSSLERKLVILHRNEEKDQPWMRKLFVENKSLFQSCHKRQLK
jgi:hypothetical protein